MALDGRPEPIALLGKRFVTDFRVAELRESADGPEAVLALYGAEFVISVAELEEHVRLGFVVEAGAES